VSGQTAHPRVLQRVADDVTLDWVGTFTPETISRFVYESYEALARRGYLLCVPFRRTAQAQVVAEVAAGRLRLPRRRRSRGNRVGRVVAAGHAA